MKIDNFTNLYPISKTLRFKLIPQGKTEYYFHAEKMLENDENRAKDYAKVKKIIDRYHIDFIERVLSGLNLIGLEQYAVFYNTAKRSQEESKKMDEISTSMRTQISKAFVNSDEYRKVFGKELIEQILPKFCEADELEAVDSFRGFTTYFTGFNENRRNMYTADGKSTEIAFRIVDQNLPKYLDNTKTWERISEKIAGEDIDILADIFAERFHLDIREMFTVPYFNNVITQSGIDIYNQLLGGYSNEDGTKVKGINEIINLYNQANKAKLPKLKQLYKQILSDRSTLSFIPEEFNSDMEVLDAIYSFHNDVNEDTKRSIATVIDQIGNLFGNIYECNMAGIYVKNNQIDINTISKLAFGNWAIVREGEREEYEKQNPIKGSREKYEEKREKRLKSIKSFNLEQIEEYASISNEYCKGKLLQAISDKVKSNVKDLKEKYEKLSYLIANKSEGMLRGSDNVSTVKDYLDSCNELKNFLKLFSGNGDEADKDEVFYGQFTSLLEQLEAITILYNRVRNYVTKKPYSDEKIKLNFNNAQLLDGWDQNKEKEHLSVILRKDGLYYLAIMTQKDKKVFEKAPECTDIDAAYQKVIYKLLPGPNKMLPKVFFSKKRLNVFQPSEEIMRIYNSGTFKIGSNFNLEDCHKLIDFFKKSIAIHEDWKNFGFEFSDTASYSNISDFYREVKEQGYKISFRDVPEEYINKLVEDGKLYLFQIYNKDFSENSKGTPNLHTMYFRALFDEDNLHNVCIALNGSAEMFYRKASLKLEDTAIHPAYKSITNKNPLNEKKESTFAYDLIKDRRYTKRQFSFHVPVMLNFRAVGLNNINYEVRNELKNTDENYVIGIDRGERNLVYVCVIDSKGKIVEQISFNEIINEYKGQTYKTDYHMLLDDREKENQQSRKEWKTIEGIKELKEGYISQVVHKICQLVVKYDAIIAMEDLNGGFKNSRKKVEKQVYQKFEKMLIDKLNYYADKQKTPEEMGGILAAYQLTNKFESFSKMGLQNGFIFYIPAWLTSKIDPSTGFANLINTRYKSVEASKELICSFDDIRFNKVQDYFEFDIDYDKFDRGVQDFRKKWTVCTYGSRIRTFINELKNSEWDSEEVNLTHEFMALFDEYKIDYYGQNLKGSILDISDAAFYRALLHLLSLTLQMRNSVTGTEIDYLISPVMNSSGEFYCSNDYAGEDSNYPVDADANGAYNIARKALWIVDQLKDADDVSKVKLSISNKEWLQYAQTHC